MRKRALIGEWPALVAALLVSLVPVATASADGLMDSPLGGAGGGDMFSAPFVAPGDTLEAHDANRRQYERMQRDAREREQYLASPEAASERRESRSEHEDLSNTEAVALLKKEFTTELKPLAPDTETLLGGNRADYIDDTTARVIGPDGEVKGLLDAQAPLRVTDPGSPKGKSDTDYDLVSDRDGGFEPDASPTNVSLPGDAEDGATIGPVTISPGGEAAAKRVDSDTMAYPNVEKDTDLVINPTPSGIETFDQLRSPDAPEDLRFKVALPPGGELHETKSGSAEVTENGKTKMTVSAPEAHDAQGEPVPSSLAVDGSTIVITTKHRDKPVAYPVLVDPLWDATDDWACAWRGRPLCSDTWFHGYGYANPSAQGPVLDGLKFWNGYGNTGNMHASWSCYTGGWFNNCFGPNNGGGYNWTLRSDGWSQGWTGLNAWVDPVQQYANQYTQFIYDPPGATTKIARADFGAKFLRRYNVAGWVVGYTGIWSPQGWVGGQPTYLVGNEDGSDDGNLTHHWNANFGSSGAAGQWAVFGLTALANTKPTGWVTGYTGAAIMQLDDPEMPNPIQNTAPSGVNGWAKAGDTFRFTPSVTDPGLGVRSLSLIMPPGYTQYNQNSAGFCSGGAASPCATNQSTGFSLENGVARSSSGFYGTAADGTIKGAPYEVPAANLPEGTSDIKFQAEDVLAGPNHTRVSPGVSVKVDRSAPTIADPTGALYENRNRTDDHRREGIYGDSAAIHIDAKDDPSAAADATTRSGVKTLSLFVDRNRDGAFATDERVASSPTSCTATQCPNAAPSIDYTLDTTGLADGDYKVKASAADAAGNAPTEKEWTVTIDRAGDIYAAREFESSASALAGESEMASEDLKLGTWLARRSEDGQLATRNTVACGMGGTARCAESRSRLTLDPDGPSPTQHHTRALGSSEDDPRIDQVSEIQQARRGVSGAPASSSALMDSLGVWQTPPPGHGDTIDRYDESTTVSVDGQEMSRTTRVWVDRSTRLPVRRQVSTGTETDYEAYYTYNRARKTDAEAPNDLFSLALPTGGPNEFNDYSASPPTPQPPVSEDTLDDRIASAVSTRQSLGLSTDDALIRDTFADTALASTINEFGIPLRSAEAALIRTRDETAAAAESSQEAEAARHPADYSGMWMDFTQGDGVVHVGYKSNLAANLAEFKAAFSYPDRVVAYQTARSLSELTALETRINSETAVLATQGIDVTSVGIDPKTNVVEVGVTDLTPSKTTTLTSRYGVGVQIVDKPPALLTADRVKGPFEASHGGIEILRPVRGTAADSIACSAGFSAQGRGSNRRRRFVLTAGHCGYPGAQFGRARYGKENAKTIGSVQFRRYEGNLDGAVIKASAGEATSRVLYNVTGDGRLQFKTIKTLARRIPSNFFNMTRVCYVGFRHSYPRCGTAGSRRTAEYCDETGGDCQRITDQGTFSTGTGRNQGLKGDSGGAVFFQRGNTTVAAGLVSGRGGGVLFYTPLARLLDFYTLDLYGQQ